MLPFDETIAAVRGAMPSIPTRIKGRGLRAAIVAPSLFTKNTLSGVKLSDFNKNLLKLSALEVWGVFETYVATFYGDSSADFEAGTARKFLIENLRITDRLGDWLFPKGAHPDMLLRVLAYLMTWMEGVDVETTFLVVVEGHLVGIEANGHIQSKFTKDAVVNPSFDWDRDYIQLQKPTVTTDNAFASFYRETLRIEDLSVQESVREALGFLYLHFGHLGRLTTYLYEGKRLTIRKGVAPALLDAVAKLRGELMDSTDPAGLLMDTLVESGLIDEEDLTDTFDNIHGMRGRWIEASLVLKWYRKLNTLTKKRKSK